VIVEIDYAGAPMRYAFFVSVFGLAASASLIHVGCTSNAASDGSTDGAAPYSLSYCPSAAASVTLTCAACVEANCASQVSTGDQACAAFLNCGCPLGVDAEACPGAPTEPTLPDGASNACATADLELEACLFGHCAADCSDAGTNG
jgi:hypothetical protein